ncbi:adenine nucleotide translocase lysine N-methyltransferase isoform X2 [Stegostoma tigrinum]|uniref:adenine nucleotide translocase lysine N-methyltransferase isoform X2 n=1 Tax=Stegostoma tigrinum TaxID=3053191 RepID=UPI00202AF5A5|nr:adenine nucleotide translocase lysine N-methyltransferase isoform X2 [Stegostoma tigrinum]
MATDRHFHSLFLFRFQVRTGRLNDHTGSSGGLIDAGDARPSPAACAEPSGKARSYASEARRGTGLAAALLFPFRRGMDQDDSEGETELRKQSVGGWGLLQIASCSGLTAYVVWAGILMPGFRRVPLRLQVPYIPASHKQVKNVMTLLEGRSGKVVDLGSGDGRIVDLSDCSNVTVFLAPSVLSLLEVKLLNELPEDAWIVAGRFPFPNWKPCCTIGDGVDKAWRYSIKQLRQELVSQNTLEGTAV